MYLLYILVQVYFIYLIGLFLYFIQILFIHSFINTFV